MGLTEAFDLLRHALATSKLLTSYWTTENQSQFIVLYAPSLVCTHLIRVVRAAYFFTNPPRKHLFVLPRGKVSAHMLNRKCQGRKRLANSTTHIQAVLRYYDYDYLRYYSNSNKAQLSRHYSNSCQVERISFFLFTRIQPKNGQPVINKLNSRAVRIPNPRTQAAPRNHENDYPRHYAKPNKAQPSRHHSNARQGERYGSH